MKFKKYTFRDYFPSPVGDWKSIMKHLSFAFLWMGAFIFAQLVACIGYLIYLLNTDVDYLLRLQQEIMPILQEDNFLLCMEGVSSVGTNLLSELIVQSLILSAIPFLLYILIKQVVTKKKIVSRMRFDGLFQTMFLATVLSFFISSVLHFVMQLLPTAYVQSLQVSEELATGASPFVLILGTGILGPIMEEVVFRYGVQRNLCVFRPTLGVVIAAFVFGVMHGNPIQSVYAFVIGLFLGFGYRETKNLLVPIVMHITINLSSVCIVLLGVNEFMFLIIEMVIIEILHCLSSAG